MQDSEKTNFLDSTIGKAIRWILLIPIIPIQIFIVYLLTALLILVMTRVWGMYWDDAFCGITIIKGLFMAIAQGFLTGLLSVYVSWHIAPSRKFYSACISAVLTIIIIVSLLLIQLLFNDMLFKNENWIITVIYGSKKTVAWLSIVELVAVIIGCCRALACNRPSMNNDESNFYFE